jgi:LacI family transcriptional regulator
VTNDQRSIIGLALQQARAAGYRRIGLVMPTWWDEYCDLAWSAGFLAHQQRLAPTERIPILYFSAKSPVEQQPSVDPAGAVPREELRRWLQAHQPDVLLSHGPFVAASLAGLDLAVPGDVAFAEIFLEKPDGRTAGVYQNCLKVGAVAVELLSSQLEQHAFGLPEIPVATLVEGRWFDGDSMPPRPPSGGLRSTSIPADTAIYRPTAGPQPPPPNRVAGRARQASVVAIGN